jgi:hypothetical protein
MSAAHKEVIEEIKIHDLAEDAMRQAKGNREKAMQIMKNRIMNDPDLMNLLIGPLLDAACRSSINTEIRLSRTMVENYIGSDDTRGLISMAKTERKAWMDYPMSTGKVLGDATKIDLTDEADMHAKLAAGNMAKVKLFRTIAEKVGRSTVRDKFSDDEIATIWSKYKT